VQERSFEQYLQIRPEQLEQLATNALEVRCQSCGATVTFTPPEVARQCDFCGVQIVAQPKSADPILAPEGILPFRITQTGPIIRYTFSNPDEVLQLRLEENGSRLDLVKENGTEKFASSPRRLSGLKEKSSASI
jgi:ribosomal protein S27E